MNFTSDKQTISSFPAPVIQQAREAGACAAIVEIERKLYYLFAYRWESIQAIWFPLPHPDQRPDAALQHCESIKKQTGIDYKKQLMRDAHLWDVRLHKTGGKVFREIIRSKGGHKPEAWLFWDSLMKDESLQRMSDIEYMTNKTGNLIISFVQNMAKDDRQEMRDVFRVLSNIHNKLLKKQMDLSTIQGRGMVVLINSANDILRTGQGSELYITTAKKLKLWNNKTEHKTSPLNAES